jgi:hypothetical protein
MARLSPGDIAPQEFGRPPGAAGRDPLIRAVILRTFVRHA